MISVKDMPRDDQMFLIGTIITPILVWWFFVGRNRYSAKGMK